MPVRNTKRFRERGSRGRIACNKMPKHGARYGVKHRNHDGQRKVTGRTRPHKPSIDRRR